MKRPLARLWRIPFLYALILALPLQLLVGATVYTGLQSYVRFARIGEKRTPPLDIDQLIYITQAELKKTLVRILASDIPSGGLEEIHLTIDGGSIGELNADLPRSGRREYKKAMLGIAGQEFPVRARYMGDSPSHWLFAKKSWRIKTRKIDPYRGRRRFNLKNSHTTLLVEDVINSEISAEIGLLTPEVVPVKLFINGRYNGLYLWWDLADEYMLRRMRRLPGSVYSGDGAPRNPKTGISSLWENTSVNHWQKIAARNAEQLDERTDIEVFISSVNHPDPLYFRRFAESFLDVQAFAKFIALDRVMYGHHHDYFHNHKIYFDSYKRKFEPIQWDMGEWGERSISRDYDLDKVFNPMICALRRHPDYEYEIQSASYKMMTTILTPSAFTKRLYKLIERIRPALAADGDRDRRISRSQNLKFGNGYSEAFFMYEFDQAVRTKDAVFGKKHAQHLESLRDSELSYCLTAQPSHPIASLQSFTLSSSGWAAQDWISLSLTGSGTEAKLFRDINGDRLVDAGDQLVAVADIHDGTARFELTERLYPGLKRIPRPKRLAADRYGPYIYAPTPLNYRYYVVSDAAIDSKLELKARNAVTKDELVVAAVAQPLATATPLHTVHPWELPAQPAPETLHYGPGDVEIAEDLITARHQRLEIAPGTNFKIGPGVNLFIAGQVHAVGTKDAPITFTALVPDQPWGAIAVQGQSSAGSRFTHCHWNGGSTAIYWLAQYTGMMNVHDSRDIVFDRCFVGVNYFGDDALHWAYVTDSLVKNCTFDGARSDSFDLDICEDVLLQDNTFKNSGNDHLDLMTCRVKVTGCSFQDSGDKGISVGEGSELRLSDSKFERCVTGVEVKDHSIVVTSGLLSISHSQTGMRLYRKNVRYTRGGQLTLQNAVIENCEVGVSIQDQSHVRMGDRVEIRDCPVGVQLLRKNKTHPKTPILDGQHFLYEGSGYRVRRSKRPKEQIKSRSND